MPHSTLMLYVYIALYIIITKSKQTKHYAVRCVNHAARLKGGLG